jgi:exopolysaccharide biosynthesis polyprenyl glycosylphosphotransferase
MLWLLFLLILWLLLLMIADGYDLLVADSRMQITARLAFATFGVGLIYLLLFFLFARPVLFTRDVSEHGLMFFDLDPPPRLIPMLWLLIGLPLLIIWRLSYIHFFTSPRLRRRAVIVGATTAGITLVRAMRSATKDYEFIGFIDEDLEKRGTYVESLKVLGDHRVLLRLIESRMVDEVIVAFPKTVQGALFQTLTYCHEQGVSIKPMTHVYEDVFGQVSVEHLGPYWFFNVSNSNYPTLYRLSKRLMDIIIGLIGLAALLFILPFIALAIYIDSPGPIFYRQERSGRGGRNFWVLKFRSMVANAEQLGQAKWAEKGDPRITRVGKFMRRVRLDELPQFINILKGDMSLVGPRPERPQFVEQLEQRIPFYRTRLSVKPGLTGWAQVRYRYASSVEDALMKLRYDLYYIKNQSLMLDLLIILKTIAVVFAFRGM